MADREELDKEKKGYLAGDQHICIEFREKNIGCNLEIIAVELMKSQILEKLELFPALTSNSL